MKTKPSPTVAALLLPFPACSALLSAASARACTVFCYGQGDTVLAGRSFDVSDDPGFGLLFVPATANTTEEFIPFTEECRWLD